MIHQPTGVCQPSRHTLVNPNRIPRELWRLPQFICWEYVENGKPKPDKAPINPKTLGRAGSTWPNTWTDIRLAVAIYLKYPHINGIAFVVTADDSYVVIDIDDCLIKGLLDPFAAEIVDTLSTYTEISPSGQGLRLIVRCGALPASRKTAGLEVYSAGRYATLTGNVLKDAPIAEFDSLEWFIERYAPRTPPPSAGNGTTRSFSCAPPTPDDDALWTEIFFRNKRAYELFHNNLTNVRTHAGAWGENHDDRPDNSTAVIMLLNSLALWTDGNAERMRRMMMQTRLDKGKWSAPRATGGDWLGLSIANSIRYMRGGQ